MIKRLVFGVVALIACISSVKGQSIVNIDLDLNNTKRLDITMDGDVYDISTTEGGGWVKSVRNSQWYNPDTTYVVEFEYMALKGVDQVKVYFDPFGKETFYLVGKLPIAEGWTKAIAIMKEKEKWTDKQASYFRFDFGINNNQTVQVRNIRLRNITDQEYFNWKNPIDELLNQKVVDYNNAVFDKKIESVAVTANEITIVGSGTSSLENCFLSEILMHENAYDMNEFIFSQALSAQNSFSVTLPRYTTKANGDQYDRLYSRWTITDASNNTLAHAHWADDVSAIAKWDIPEERPKSPKGMGGVGSAKVDSLHDLVELGVHNITFNVLYPTLISLNATSISHELNGKTYYINPNSLSRVDAMLKKCSDNDILVSLILLAGSTTAGELGEIFVHPDCNGGSFALANVVEERGVEYYLAVLDFLASRYSRPDKKYGRITNWIVHNEVDAAPAWTNAGDKPQDLYLEQYSRSMRSVYYTARKYNPASKVFISLTKHWRDKHTYSTPELLQSLIDQGKRDGEFEWGLAFHPYPENLREPDPWDDHVTVDLSTAGSITPKNLELIDKWVRTPGNLYKDCKVRSLLFSENGISHLGRYDREQFDLQCAGMAYYWKKLIRLPSVEAYHYHQWVDKDHVAGLRFGLWSFKEGTYNDFGKKKPSWTLYKYTQTTQQEKAFEFTKKIIGINDWSEIYNEVNPELDLYKIRYEILQGGAPVIGAKVWYNKEMRTSNESGKCTFFNVASSVGETSLKIITADNAEHTFTIDANGSKLVVIDLETKATDEESIQTGYEITEEESYIPFDYRTWFEETGVKNDRYSDQIILYPNPSRDKVYVENNYQVKEPVNIEVFDIAGNAYDLDFQTEGDRISIDITKLPHGYYIANIPLDQVSVQKPFCKIQ